MKRTLSLVLALVMVLGTFTTVMAAEPTVEELAGAFLLQEGVLEGDDGNLMLDQNLKRRDMVILLSRLLGVEDEAKVFPAEELTFEDITDSHYEGYLAWSVENGLIEGHDEKTFGFNEAITAQDYATVLLRALGYEIDDAAWKVALETAKELGILADVEVKNATEISRGQMAVMTLNALAVKVEGSEETLAEKLGIELPVPAVLEVEEVKADNLKEIKVVFNKEVDVNLEDTDLFSVSGLTIEDAVLEGNVLVLSVKGTMTNKKAYKLVIKGTEGLDGTYEFTAEDNAIPAVVDVVGLGTKAVKVTMTEPVKEVAKVSSFTIDGKAVYGTVNVIGKEIVIKTYNALSVGEHEITINSLEDYAGFKSLVTTMPFEVVEDKDAPTVENVEAPALEKVIVTFSEEVDPATVNNKTIYHGNKVYPTAYKALAGNKYEFTFEGDKGLPLHETTIYISGVADYSGNKMTAAEASVKATVDLTRPEVEEVTISVDRETITIKFNKLVNITDGKFTVLDKKDNKVAISDVKAVTNTTSTRSVKVHLGKALVVGDEYVLKIADVKDTNKYPNYMADYSEKISTSDLGQPKLGPVVINEDAKDEDVVVYTIDVFFDKNMDLSTVSNPENYLVELNGKSNVLLSKLDWEIAVKDSNGRRVEITVTVDKDDSGDHDEVTGIAGLEIKGANGKGLSNYGKIETHEKVDFGKATATATAKDTIKVEFNKEIKTAPASAFTVAGNTVDSVNISGKTVTLTLDKKLPADAEVEFEISDKVVAYDGDKYVVTEEVTLVDKIAPSIKEVEAKLVDGGTKVAISVTFDEKLQVIGEDEDTVKRLELAVRRNTGDTKIEDYSITQSEDGKSLVITIDSEKVNVNSTRFTVAFNGLGLITDASVNANKLAKDSKETNMVNDILKAKEEADKAEEAAEKVVDAELAKVKDVELAEGSAVDAETVATALGIDTEKVTVSVEVVEDKEDTYKVTLTSKAVNAVSKSVEVVVTVEA